MQSMHLSIKIYGNSQHGAWLNAAALPFGPARFTRQGLPRAAARRPQRTDSGSMLKTQATSRPVALRQAPCRTLFFRFLIDVPST